MAPLQPVARPRWHPAELNCGGAEAGGQEVLGGSLGSWRARGAMGKQQRQTLNTERVQRCGNDSQHCGEALCSNFSILARLCCKQLPDFPTPHLYRQPCNATAANGCRWDTPGCDFCYMVGLEWVGVPGVFSRDQGVFSSCATGRWQRSERWIPGTGWKPRTPGLSLCRTGTSSRSV